MDGSVISDFHCTPDPATYAINDMHRIGLSNLESVTLGDTVFISGLLAFQVPKDMKKFKLYFKNPLSNKEIVYTEIGNVSSGFQPNPPETEVSAHIPSSKPGHNFINIFFDCKGMGGRASFESPEG